MTEHRYEKDADTGRYTKLVVSQEGLTREDLDRERIQAETELAELQAISHLSDSQALKVLNVLGSFPRRSFSEKLAVRIAQAQERAHAVRAATQLQIEEPKA